MAYVVIWPIWLYGLYSYGLYAYMAYIVMAYYGHGPAVSCQTPSSALSTPSSASRASREAPSCGVYIVMAYVMIIMVTIRTASREAPSRGLYSYGLCNNNNNSDKDNSVARGTGRRFLDSFPSTRVIVASAAFCDNGYA